VVEGELDAFDLALGEPSRLRGVVAASDLPGDRHGFVKDSHVVSPRVAPGIRVHAEEGADLDHQPRLLRRLPGAAVLRRLVPFEEAAGEPPPALEGGTPAPDEEEPAGAVHDPRVDRDARHSLALVEEPGINHGGRFA